MYVHPFFAYKLAFGFGVLEGRVQPCQGYAVGRRAQHLPQFGFYSAPCPSTAVFFSQSFALPYSSSIIGNSASVLDRLDFTLDECAREARFMMMSFSLLCFFIETHTHTHTHRWPMVKRKVVAVEAQHLIGEDSEDM